MQWAARDAKQCALLASGKSKPHAGVLINFMSTHIDFFIDFKAWGKMYRILECRIRGILLYSDSHYVSAAQQ